MIYKFNLFFQPLMNYLCSLLVYIPHQRDQQGRARRIEIMQIFLIQVAIVVLFHL